MRKAEIKYNDQKAGTLIQDDENDFHPACSKEIFGTSEPPVIDFNESQIAKAILKYSMNPGLDVINFYEQVLFSFLTGNAGIHLKNFNARKTELRI